MLAAQRRFPWLAPLAVAGLLLASGTVGAQSAGEVEFSRGVGFALGARPLAREGVDLVGHLRAAFVGQRILERG